MLDWILRFVKGIVIGSGFILPGVSGGALAAVFGVYERIIHFLAHFPRDFKKNIRYLIPLGLGGAAGVFLLSFAVSYLFGAYEAQILWLFVGCIVGTLPALWRQAGKKGRQGKHLVILAASFLFSIACMLYGGGLFGKSLRQTPATWVLAGILVGLGIIVPGLSPSNFLVYMGMYTDLAHAIKGLDLAVILPVSIGAALSLLLFSKLVGFVLKKAYTELFHGILGLVFASTAMIVPLDVTYSTFSMLTCLVLCAAGVAVGLSMCALELRLQNPSG